MSESLGLDEIWRIQHEQQQLWHDWSALSEQDRITLAKELMLGFNEESADLLRTLNTSKYHMLKSTNRPSKAAIAEAGVDVLKMLVALMDLHGISPEEMVVQFRRKTEVVDRRWRLECDAMQDVPVLMCDLDDCVADWHRDFYAWADVYGLPLVDVNGVEEAKEHFYSHGGFLAMSPIAGAVESLNRWQEMRNNQTRLILVTSRPYRRHTRVYADTLEWCRNVGLKHDHIIFTSDKTDAVRQVAPAKIVAMIEDRMKYAQELALIGVTVLKLPGCDDIAGFNHPNVYHCHDWSDIRIALGIKM